MKVDELTEADRELLTNFDLIPGVDVQYMDVTPADGPLAKGRRIFLVSVPVEPGYNPASETEYWPVRSVGNLVKASNNWRHRHDQPK